jgi:hypothetical protein
MGWSQEPEEAPAAPPALTHSCHNNAISSQQPTTATAVNAASMHRSCCPRMVLGLGDSSGEAGSEGVV